jgi:hypothetical protein
MSSETSCHTFVVAPSIGGKSQSSMFRVPSSTLHVTMISLDSTCRVANTDRSAKIQKYRVMVIILCLLFVGSSGSRCHGVGCLKNYEHRLLFANVVCKNTNRFTFPTRTRKFQRGMTLLSKCRLK